MAAHLASEVPVDGERSCSRPQGSARCATATSSATTGDGAGPKSVQVQLGHSTITTTFDVYGHLFEGHLDDVMDRLDAEWRQASA